MFLFFKGFVIGFSIASQLGPLGVLCIRRTLANGFLSGFSTGMGIASGDAVYGTIAILGITSISGFLIDQEIILRLIGGSFLIHIGSKSFKSSVPVTNLELPPRENNILKWYSSAFFLTLTNPMTIMSFTALIVGAGIPQNNEKVFTSLLFVLGIFMGSMIQKTCLSAVVTFFRVKFNFKTIKYINYFAGFTIISFGIISVLTALSRLR